MPHYVSSFTTARAYQQLLEEATDRLVFLMPFLKMGEELQQCLERSDRSKLDVLFVFSQSRLDQDEVDWLRSRYNIRLRRAPSVYARCCLNEQSALLTTRSPYRQHNTDRYDMGFLVHKAEDPQLFRQVYDDVYRIVGDSREISPQVYQPTGRHKAAAKTDCLADWVIAERMQLSLEAYYEMMIDEGYLQRIERKLELTEKGREVGGKAAFSRRYGPYFVWPKETS